MARELTVLWAGRHQRGAWETICADYRKRISRMAAIRDRPVKVRGGAQGEVRRREEGRSLLAAAPSPRWGIALDSRGGAVGSEELASYLEQVQQEWPHAVAFFIGSDLGLASEVLEDCRRVLSFGPMTLGHELARTVLYEQLYRALSIQRGMNYHRRQV